MGHNPKRRRHIVLTVVSPVSEDGCAWTRNRGTTEWFNLEGIRKFYEAEGYTFELAYDQEAMARWNQPVDKAKIRDMVEEAIKRIRSKKAK